MGYTMRSLAGVLLLLLCCVSSTNGQKTRLSDEAEKPKAVKVVDYPVKMHISASHIRPDCSGPTPACSVGLFADATVNGKKLELQGTASIEKHGFALLVPGDYQARLAKDVHLAGDAVIGQGYEVLLPDGVVWHCTLSGITE